VGLVDQMDLDALKFIPAPGKIKGTMHQI
jgi:hypothetical protein